LVKVGRELEWHQILKKLLGRMRVRRDSSKGFSRNAKSSESLMKSETAKSLNQSPSAKELPNERQRETIKKSNYLLVKRER